MTNLDEIYGLVNVSLAQSIETQIIDWKSRTLMDTLAQVGGQIIAILGISQFFLMNYQQFSYDKNALKQLYYETKE